MIPITVSVLLASALCVPAAALSDPPPDGSMIIQVEVPERSATPAPAAADDRAPGTLPATGGELALWGGALALAALAGGAALRAWRRRA
ncbi:LPXTG cell wall anchor domain-containing protein [Microbacterium trichothecenolyticum]|uniref:LPXTG-motif cell wall-anchored protein n=1 Tax=Microbacterium trichothecenolyticum TaxID=69370 RepID=A0ABU0TWN2_MICTR|nr:LPXTG cell wall anchor domain-containing protein [Microbacterium trichothecenolyticum]MDQ1124072.1 LPXTG-motif cell wall-anchored protein [Microbacterium trichothecenolyticum]